MKRWTAAGMIALILTRRTRYESSEEVTEAEGNTSESGVEVRTEATEKAAPVEAEVISTSSYSPRNPVKVKGIYVSAYMAGTSDMMDQIIEETDETELNAAIIDVEDNQGRIIFVMDSPTVNEINTCQPFIDDLPGPVRKLNEHDIYPTARVAAFRDPYLAEQEPEQSLHTEDGSICRDNKDLAWANPYKQKVWDYLTEVGKKAKEMGFKGIQLDYIRFAVNRIMKDMMLNEAGARGRDKTQTITEFVSYAYDEPAREGFFVSADVFGAIMRSEGDIAVVGQKCGDMTKYLDYICPMIYPSHYGSESFDIKDPDKQPYGAVGRALKDSIELLAEPRQEHKKQAVVCPQLQDFIVSYLKDYMNYEGQEVRWQIQAAYDFGYDEWILWDASVSYHYGDPLTPEETAAEEQAVEEPRISKAPEDAGLLDTETQGPESGPSRNPAAR